MNFSIDRLFPGGGLIVTYACTSACKHCLYKSSPQRDKKYLSEESTEKIFAILQSLSCSAIHIGGGEPFINFPALLKVCQIAKRFNIEIEYIETNASWAGIEEEKIFEMLRQLYEAGVNTLLISISPFHNEFIPWKKTERLMNLCEKAGFDVLHWMSEFIGKIRKFNTDSKHKLSEYERQFGADFINFALGIYHVRFGGRAAMSFKNKLASRSAEEIIEMSNGGCTNLLYGDHFHIDCYEKYIPGLCTGLAIDLQDLNQVISRNKYPLLVLLISSGIRGLYDFAVSECGFKAEAKYINKCHLCNDIRKFIFKQKNIFRELAPSEYYSLD